MANFVLISSAKSKKNPKVFDFITQEKKLRKFLNTARKWIFKKLRKFLRNSENFIAESF